jgi:hypothetical protein
MNPSPAKIRFLLPAACGLMFLIGNIHSLGAEVPETKQPESLTFEKHVAPILKSRCQKCHGAAKREGGLDLRRRFTIVKGGDSGPALDLKHADKSLLLEMVQDGLMPPEEEPRLTKGQLDVLKRWILAGSPLAGKTEAPLPPPGEITEELDPAARRHWSFQPVGKVPVPEVKNIERLRTPVDAFVLAALEQQEWQPASEATRAQWIRRVSYDLTGLPPTPEEIQAFEHDKDANAYEKVVDRLLSSSHYGERWAQHWLDVVRFSETEGFEYDRHLPDAWRFRDYAIESFNSDKPFDRFIAEQIAGDEFAPEDPDCLTASIFHRLGAVRRNAGNPDIALSRNEVLTERTNIIGEAFLGLTVGCARCHNHKLEPITQKDYYRLQAYFAATQEHNQSLAAKKEQEAFEAETKQIQKQIADLKERADKAGGSEKDRLTRQMEALEAKLPPHPPTIPGIRNDLENKTAIHVLRRGVWEQKGVAVGPRPLSVLVSASFEELDSEVENPRTQLAKWLTDPAHPLTARVIVNRIWQQHFGTGLVRTANDFGTNGDPPRHPELLDWLAKTFVENGWRMKPIHRMIVLSSTYRQSSRSQNPAEYLLADPDNRLLWRFPRRRLSAEEIRDSLLAVSGRLNPKLGGASVMVPVEEELVELLYNPSQWQVTPDENEHNRRSIYLIAKRNLRLPFMEAFDAPALQTSCPRRESSTHAPQALALLNGRFANEMAAAFARRLGQECGDDPPRLVERAFWLALGRRPTDSERELSVEFLADQSLKEFALAVLNLNGFVYVQ